MKRTKATIVGSILLLVASAGMSVPAVAQQAVRRDARNKDTAAMKREATDFLQKYEQQLAQLERKANLAHWEAATTGKSEAFDAAAAASLELRRFHSDPEAYRRVKQWHEQIGSQLPAQQRRCLKLVLLAYQRNQLPPELLKQMVELSTEIEKRFNTYRAELDGRRYSNNDLLEMLADENDSERRHAIWSALKQVGAVVAPKLIELAELRNRGARQLGFTDYWDMSIRLQEHDPVQLLSIFEELDRLTAEPFRDMKAEMDSELASRFGIDRDALMPWHYDNPFFQAAPPSAAVDLNEFYEDKPKEQIVEIARRFFSDIGLPIDDIIERSDLYEREGKDQHAFCTHIDRSGDVRTLCNIKATAEWMDTMLHEQGHAVYDVHIDRNLPYVLREPAHIFTTEGIAMLFGALAKTPAWIVHYAEADAKRVDEVASAILEQRRREQLIFARWTMVMLHFERALYQNPRQPLNRLWWDHVERYQNLHRPPRRDQPDWAAKPHFTIAPVYYHNYMLGELFAAQLRRSLADLTGHQGPAYAQSFVGKPEVGTFLKRHIFRPGSSVPWPEFVEQATGTPFSARFFADEVAEHR